MAGTPISLLLTFVKEHSVHLSTTSPDFVPHNLTCSIIDAVGKLITHSPDSLSKLYENRLGRILNDTIGGSEHIVPTHASVIIDSLESCLTDTKTTGFG